MKIAHTITTVALGTVLAATSAFAAPTTKHKQSTGQDAATTSTSGKTTGSKKSRKHRSKSSKKASSKSMTPKKSS